MLAAPSTNDHLNETNATMRNKNYFRILNAIICQLWNLYFYTLLDRVDFENDLFTQIISLSSLFFHL